MTLTLGDEFELIYPSRFTGNNRRKRGGRCFFYPNKESKDCCCGGGGFALAAIIPIVGAATGADFGFSPVSPPRSAKGSFLWNMLKKRFGSMLNNQFFFLFHDFASKKHKIQTRNQADKRLTIHVMGRELSLV